MTLTTLYNVLELVQSGESLTSRDKVRFEQGDVETLRDLHEELDVAVSEVYGVDVEAEDNVLLGQVTCHSRMLRATR